MKMDRMPGNSNQQQQTPHPTTYAAPRQRTRQVLDFDDDGQLTIIDVPILSPGWAAAPVNDAPEEVVPEEAAPAEEVEQIPEHSTMWRSSFSLHLRHSTIHAEQPQWQYLPQNFHYWYGAPMNHPHWRPAYPSRVVLITMPELHQISHIMHMR
ncbi:hypothetical protein CAEBREN_25561 [Caenorhabditis brenneri]|uniref:Uncharacterized protein n=1 Tax=Caenorhabditis brenneri TaxID=135651 RepID=G0MB60_CAEBE|nr:hypothetical protein CAEBREN_25561 [Caenorhabditis brenneri]